MSARPSRRAVLGAGLAATAAACTPHRAARPRPDPDRALLTQARADEAALAGMYDGLLGTASAQLRPTLSRLRDAHAAHLVALGAPAPPTPTTSPTSSPGAPASPAATLGPVIAAEGRALLAHRSRAAQAGSGANAALLASVAAAAGSYATTLRAMSAR